MDDILAKKNRHLFLEEKDNVGNSFIANVNNIADDLDNIDAVANDLGRIDTVADNIDNVNTVAENIDDINTTVENLDKIDQFNDNLIGLLESLLEQLGEDGNAWLVRLTELGESILATTSAFNYAVTTTLTQDIASNATLTLPEAMKYRVGTHMLMVSWNGTVCYIGDQYNEVGSFGQWSTTITMNVPLKTGDKIQFRVVALADAAAFIGQIDSVIGNTSVVATGSTENRTLADRFADIVNVKDFGAVGDGITDDTTAIQSAVNFGVLQGKAVFFPSGQKWFISKINVPNNSTIIANHSILIHDGSSYFTTDSETGTIDFHPVIKVGSNVTIDSLTIEFPQEQNAELDGAMLGVYVNGTGFHADELFFVCYPTTTVENPGEGVANNAGCTGYGIYVDADDSDIGFIGSLNIHRPICYGINNNVDGFWLGGYLIESYIRGIKLHRAKNGYIGTGKMQLRPANIGTVKSGWNGILIEQSENVTFADCEIDDAPEHGIRFGGYWNKNFKFGDLILKRNGGSAIKLNSHDPLDPDRQANENISFGNVTVFDNRYVDPDDEIELTRRGEIIRLSHAHAVTFASISCFADVSEYTGSTVIAVNNVSQIDIASVLTEKYSGVFFHVNESNDVDSTMQNPENFEVRDVFLKNVNVKDSEATSRNFTTFSLVKSSVSNILFDVSSDSFNRYIFSCPNETTGSVSNITFTGSAHSGSLRYSTPVFYLDKIWLDMKIGGRTVTGPGNSSYAYLVGFGSVSHFDPTADSINGSLFITDKAQAEEPSLTFGGSIVFGKPGSSGRRGAAIATMQTGVTVAATGLVVFTHTATTASNILTKGFVFSHSGSFYPYVSLAGNLGGPDNLWANVYAETSSIGSSDVRIKTDIQDINEALMRAWSRVRFKVFKFVSSVEEKGQNARAHVGVIAQDVANAFIAEGLDASVYGLFCYDSWDAREETRVVVDVPAVLDDDGNEITPAQTHLETVIIPAGDRYGIRYEEALVLECAYQRWLGEQRDAKIEALMQRISALENNR